jgi:hypothetical protein
MRWNAPLLASENTVEFEVLPQDKAAAGEEVEAIVARTGKNSDRVLAAPDAVRLFEIGTPQARQAALRLYASNNEDYSQHNPNYAAVAAVLAAPTRAETIRLLRQRLQDPAVPPDYELFFDLPVLELEEKNPELTADSIRNGSRVNGDHWRNALTANIQAQYQAIMAGLDQRPAPVRALTVRFLHLNLSGIHKACSVSFAAPAEDIAKLRMLRLETLADLPEREQGNDLQSLHWWTNDLPQDQMVPLLEKLFEKVPEGSDRSRIGILRGIGKFDPQLAGKLFRRRMIDHGWMPGLSNFIPEAWFDAFGAPELDDYFAKTLATAHTEEMERIAPFLARFGTAAILPEIQRVYGMEGANWPCSLQTGLLTYFLRVDPVYGLAQTQAALEKSYARPEGQCRESNLLVAMALLRKAPELEALAYTALADSRPLVAWGGARVLGILLAPDLPYQRLLDRLQQLHEQWPDYESRSKDPAYLLRWKSGYDRLESIIVQLLTNTTSAKLLLVQKAALEVCVTEACRLRVGARLRDAPLVTRQADQ